MVMILKLNITIIRFEVSNFKIELVPVTVEEAEKRIADYVASALKRNLFEFRPVDFLIKEEHIIRCRKLKTFGDFKKVVITHCAKSNLSSTTEEEWDTSFKDLERLMSVDDDTPLIYALPNWPYGPYKMATLSLQLPSNPIYIQAEEIL
jgi:hypothetical protein